MSHPVPQVDVATTVDHGAAVMLRARETMVGAFALDRHNSEIGDRPISLTLCWRVRSLTSLWRDGVELRGEIHAQGFADHAPAVGQITMPSLGSARYELAFASNDGAPHRLEGCKQLSLSGVPAGLSVLRGQLLTAQGSRVGRALLRFDLQNDLLSFLRSIERCV